MTSESQNGSGNGNTVVGAVALAGVAAAGFGVRAIVRRARTPRVFGVKVPRNLHTQVRRASKIDLQTAAKELTRLAERVEQASEGVRVASQQTKNVGRRFS